MPVRLLCLLLTLSFSLSVAHSAEGAVIINEVAWMGSAISPNHEWIELLNTGDSSVSLEGWTLTDGVNLTILLTGTLSGGAYGVLERTSDDSAPGSALLTYTGALVNTGTTLTLKRADNQIEDQVAGGENWSTIGGDNSSKATAQYTVNGWRTGSATPGAANTATAVVEDVVEENDEENDQPNEAEEHPGGSASPARTTSSRSKTTPLIPATTELTLTIEAQEIAYVNQEVVFTVVPKGIGKTITASLGHNWNFGDLTTASGTKVTHAYKRAGTYIVTHHAYFGRHDVVARREITVLPVTMTLSFDSSGDLLLHNNAAYDIDVSGYLVAAGEVSRIFPPHSLVMAKQSLPLPFSRARIIDAALYDNRKVVVARTSGLAAVDSVVVATPRQRATEYLVSAPPVSTETVLRDDVEVPAIVTINTTPTGTRDTQVASSGALTASVMTARGDQTTPWAYALLCVLILAVIGILFTPLRRQAQPLLE